MWKHCTTCQSGHGFFFIEETGWLDLSADDKNPKTFTIPACRRIFFSVSLYFLLCFFPCFDLSFIFFFLLPVVACAHMCACIFLFLFVIGDQETWLIPFVEVNKWTPCLSDWKWIGVIDRVIYRHLRYAAEKSYRIPENKIAFKKRVLHSNRRRWNVDIPLLSIYSRIFKRNTAVNIHTYIYIIYGIGEYKIRIWKHGRIATMRSQRSEVRTYHQSKILFSYPGTASRGGSVFFFAYYSPCWWIGVNKQNISRLPVSALQAVTLRWSPLMTSWSIQTLYSSQKLRENTRTGECAYIDESEKRVE